MVDLDLYLDNQKHYITNPEVYYVEYKTIFLSWHVLRQRISGVKYVLSIAQILTPEAPEYTNDKQSRALDVTCTNKSCH